MFMMSSVDLNVALTVKCASNFSLSNHTSLISMYLLFYFAPPQNESYSYSHVYNQQPQSVYQPALALTGAQLASFYSQGIKYCCYLTSPVMHQALV